MYLSVTLQISHLLPDSSLIRCSVFYYSLFVALVMRWFSSEERAARSTRILRDKNLGNAGVFVLVSHVQLVGLPGNTPTDSTDHCTEISRRAMLFKSHGTILVILQVRLSPWIRSRPGKILLALLTCICW